MEHAGNLNIATVLFAVLNSDVLVMSQILELRAANSVACLLASLRELTQNTGFSVGFPYR